MTDARDLLRAALAVVRTRPAAAIRRLEGLRASTADPRLRARLWPALVALRRGRRVDAERWISRALEYEAARRSRRDIRR